MLEENWIHVKQIYPCDYEFNLEGNDFCLCMCMIFSPCHRTRLWERQHVRQTFSCEVRPLHRGM